MRTGTDPVPEALCFNYFKHETGDKVQRLDDSKCDALLSESFRIALAKK
jgi:hypothetical protein